MLLITYLIILSFILAPAYAVKFSTFNYPTNLLMVWVFFVWLIFFVYLLTKKQFSIFFLSIKNIDKKVLIFTGLFFLSGLISLFVKGVDRAKLGQFIVIFLQPISIFFIARFVFQQDPKTKYLLPATCYLLLAIAGLYAMFQYFTLIGLPAAWWGNSNEPKRALSFFVHPNFYALWSAPLLAFLIPDFAKNIGVILNPSASEGEESLPKIEVLPLHSDALIQGQDGTKKTWPIIKAFFWLLGALGLFLSLSRAGWLGLAAAVAVYLIIAADKKTRRFASVIVIFIIVIIIAIPNFRYRVLLPFYGEKSAVSRVSLWETGWKGIKESPIVGLGLTGFSQKWPALNTDPGLTETHNFPHNIFLDFWVETGLLGLISLTGLMGLLIYRGLRKQYSPPFQGGAPAAGGEGGWSNNETLKLAVALFLIALLVQGQIDNPYFKNDLAMVFWVILSLVI